MGLLGALFLIIISILMSLLISHFIRNSFNNLILTFFLRLLSFIFFTVSHQSILYDCNEIYLSILYFKSNFSFIRICVVYLLLVLIIRIKISQKFKGRIKSKIQE